MFPAERLRERLAVELRNAARIGNAAHIGNRRHLCPAQEFQEIREGLGGMADRQDFHSFRLHHRTANLEAGG